MSFLIGLVLGTILWQMFTCAMWIWFDGYDDLVSISTAGIPALIIIGIKAIIKAFKKMHKKRD